MYVRRPFATAFDRTINGQIYTLDEPLNVCRIRYSNDSLNSLPEVWGHGVTSIDQAFEWGSGIYFPYLACDAVVLEPMDEFQRHSYSGVGPKSTSRWNTRNKQRDIVVNDDFRWRVNAYEVPKPERVSGVAKLTYLDASSSPEVTRCGNQSSVLDKYGMLRSRYTAALPYGTVAQRINYDKVIETAPFVSTFTEARALELVNEICVPRVDDGVVTATVAEMNGKTWDIAAELGELPETVRMVYDACKKALKMKRTTQRKVQELAFSDRNSVQIADATASLWMAYRYGLGPIALSIESALEALKFKNYGLYQTVRQGLTESYEVSSDVLEARVQYHGRSWMKSRFEAELSRFARGLRFDIVPAAWELLPVSFVTDWFLNVGDVLSAATAPDIQRVDVNSYSNKYDVGFKLTLSNSVVYGSISAYRYTKINPSEYIGLSLNPNLGLKRKLDALALGWFSFRSRG